MEAHCLLRNSVAYRREAFCAGLSAAGFKVAAHPKPSPENLLVIWNRTSGTHGLAHQYESAGGSVIVAENGYLGRDYQGTPTYALSRNWHNGKGRIVEGDDARIDRWNLQLQPWRRDGKHLLILPSRGIGMAPVAQPRSWLDSTLNKLQRITSRVLVVRRHPGAMHSNESLMSDLRNAWACVTWASGAGVKALVAGVPVFHDFPEWIGSKAARPLSGADIEQPYLGDRSAFLKRLAWSMWKLDEIADGRAFRHLLQ